MEKSVTQHKINRLRFETELDMTSESVLFQHYVGSCHFPSCSYYYF